jgi:Zn-dependent protease with chaperone function
MDWSFYPFIIFYLITVQEFYHWAKIGRRSEMSDIIAIGFFFFLIFFFTKDILTSLMGAFSIYMWFGLYELKDYPIINKILLISLITYNIIFIAGLISSYLQNPFFLNTAFAFSFWIILILGFVLFGRKYIVVWRFMSPAYLTLFLYIIAWIAVIFVNQYTPIDFNINTPIGPIEINLIYPVLIGVNWLVYFVSGPVLDFLLGIQRVNNEELLLLVDNVKKDIGIKGKIKVGFGKYPILNAMAYGSVFDKRIAIIAESKHQIPEDELKGIVAHELAHTKGKHTLILTILATVDFMVRMLIGFPATYYDYTFGEPKIPMIYFILFNILVFIILFIFVRFLEAKADLATKNAGYSKELAKALYNLESFYNTGREFGLNTMLLSDEKITRYNQILDYVETAEYLNESMIKPERASLLANIMNSHPPSYFRIAAILGDDLKPWKEALLPFICLKRTKQIKYAKRFDTAREKFKMIANEKFKEKFQISDLSMMFYKLNKKEPYKLDLSNDFIFKNKITNELLIGKLEDVKFVDDVGDSVQYLIKSQKENQYFNLNASLYTKERVDFNKSYYLEKESPLLLHNISIEDDKKEGNYIFKNNGDIISKSIKKTKLPNSINIIENFKNQYVFLKIKGVLKVFKCINVNVTTNFDDIELVLLSQNDHTQLSLKLKDLIIKPQSISLSISNNVNFRDSEIELINWLIKNQIFSTVYLKKPVNNIEFGYITQILPNEIGLTNYPIDSNADDYSLVIQNIFDKQITIPYKMLELITFEYKTATIKKKSDTSMFSKLGYKIFRKLKPKSIFYVNKV